MLDYENLLRIIPPQITRSYIEHCDHWEKMKTIILSYLSGAFPDKVK